MKSLEIRQKFLEFFKQRGHTIVPSSSLIPAQDPTLLFANAGMNQFKDLFLGKETRSYKRAASIQKCMRAGGKHNDLDNVGFTKRHLTFFEMMGNFSFGDYFKKDAIAFAWDFLIKEMGFDINTLHATVYHDDQESYDIWLKDMGVPAERIHKLGAKDNFWQMGDTGPCGPCTELHVDRGPAFGCDPVCDPSCDCDRFLEVWNMVFMQFDRQPDGTDKPLKQPGVDTGMGLERLTALVQNVDSVFATDLFTPMIERLEQLSGRNYKKETPEMQAAFHVLADHIRASCLLIADGCSPSNEGRGYVLRKVIRRAALFAQRIKDMSLFAALADVVIESMGTLYPELVVNKVSIKKLITSEVERFSANLERGQAILEEFFTQAQHNKELTGLHIFKLYDTYGFPLELTRVIASERGFSLDEMGFEAYMTEQRERSGKKDSTHKTSVELPEEITTEFMGYTNLEVTSPIIALLHDGKIVQTVSSGQKCEVICMQSPFYVEKGGQISDQGWISINDAHAAVTHLAYHGNAIAATIIAPCMLSIGQNITQVVDRQKRLDTMKNHTATHLLQAALQEMFGKQVKQAGSLVAPDYLRFDYTYHEPLSAENIKQIEKIVNMRVMENIPVDIYQTTFKEATNKGVIAFFGDKYNPENVRVVSVPGFSAELCGGTHVKATGDIGCFKITQDSALSAGQRRIVAVTGPKAVELFQESYSSVKNLSQEFKVQPHELVDAVAKLRDQFKTQSTEVKQLKRELLQAQIPAWLEKVQSINGLPSLVAVITDGSAEDPKELATALESRKKGLYCIITTSATASTLYCQLSPEFQDKIDLKKMAEWLKDNAGIRGGAKATTIQGGGSALSQDMAQKIMAWLKTAVKA